MAMNITTLLVDLDGTLYDITNGYEEHVRQDNLQQHSFAWCSISAVFTCMLAGWRQ